MAPRNAEQEKEVLEVSNKLLVNSNLAKKNNHNPLPINKPNGWPSSKYKE